LITKKSLDSRKTRMRSMEEALDYAESIVETVREPLLVLDSDLRVVSANRGFYTTFQVSPEETENSLIYELGNHQWDIPELRRLLEEVLPQNTSFSDYLIEHEFSGIGMRVMLLNARRLYRETNETERILLAIEDITELKKAENKLKSYAEHLEELVEERTYALGERVKELTCLYELNNLIAQPGISLSSILQSLVHLVPPAFRYPEVTCARVALGEDVFASENFRESECRQSSDIVVHGAKEGALEVYILEEKRGSNEGPFQNDERNLIKAITERLGRVTARIRAESKLEEYTQNLEEMVEARTSELKEAHEQLVRREKLAVLGQLAGGVSHELRNPLGAIKNAIYFLNLVIEDPEPEVKETLEILDREVSTSEKIISSILDFARVKPPTLRKEDINEILQETLSNASIPENILIETQLAENIPPILADPDQLTRVFGNIILNAVQAMPRGGQITIKSETTSTGA